MAKEKKSLEKNLKGLPEALPEVMKGWHFSKKMRQRVQKEISFLSLPDETPVWVTPHQKKSYGKIFNIAASVLVLAGIFCWRPPAAGERNAGEMRMLPVETRYVDLDGQNPEEMVSIWRVEGLDSYVVFVGFRENGEQWDFKYAYPLRGSQVLPVELRDSAGGQGKEVWITYQKPESESYFSLILKNDGRIVTSAPAD
ncbi:MAG: hypothetical protein ACUVSK_10225 [Desulfotomaculales bacterium]